MSDSEDQECDSDSESESISAPESSSSESADGELSSHFADSHCDGSDVESIDTDFESVSSDHSSSSSATVESESDDDAEPVNKFSHPSLAETVHAGVSISVFESHLLLYEFIIKHSLSTAATDELLHLFELHLPQPTKLPKSSYALKQFFTSLFPDLVSSIHYYCSSCHRLLSNSSPCNEPTCVRVGTGQACDTFISVSLQSQLKRKLEDPDFWKLLEHRFTRHQLPGVIQDVYDGAEYKRHSVFLSNPSNLSFTCNSDGVAVFQSSSIELWPIWLSINELPKEVRFDKKNMILGALWFASDKPTFATFMRPLMDSFNDLYKNGIKVQSPNGEILCRAILLQVSADLPARALILSMKQFNGAFACLYCEARGTTSPSNHLHRFWPLEPDSPERNHSMMLRTAQEAITSGVAVKGVFGATVLCIHRPFDIVKGVVVDDLHCLFLGVTKTLLKLWFADKNKQCDFYVGNKIDLCDQRITQIKVTDTISRVPRKLSDRKHWKGSEFRTWILFLALPVMLGVLEPCYYNHVCLFVAALHILYSDYITSADLEKARLLLTNFYSKFSDLYGNKQTTMNVHLLSHVTMCVKNWGPLWAYSCFHYENMNREVKKLFRGTRNMSKQLSFSFVMQQLLPSIRSQVPLSGMRVRKRHQHAQQLQEETYAVGKILSLGLEEVEFPVREYVNERCHVGSSSLVVHTFYRLRKNKEMFTSIEYSRVKRRNSHTVLYSKDGAYYFGLVVQYYYFKDGQCSNSLNTIIATIRRFQVLSKIKDNIPITKVHPTDLIDIVCVQQIREKCLFVSTCIESDSTENSTFVCRFPCKILGD